MAVRTKTYLKHVITVIIEDKVNLFFDTGSLWGPYLLLAYSHAPSPYPFYTLNAKLSGKRHSISYQTKMHVIQIKKPTRCNSFTGLLLDVYVWLNMFRAPLRPSSGVYNCTRSLWFYRWNVVGRGLAGLPDHDQQRSNRHAPTVKPEAPSAVVRSWWWARGAPETRWATRKRQVINLWNSCILLVDLFESYDDARTCERQNACVWIPCLSHH